MPALNPTAIRLGVQGDADVKRAFDEVRKSGQDSFKGIADSADTQTARIERAYERDARAAIEAAEAAERAERRRAASADKVASIMSRSPRQIAQDTAVGTGYSGPSAAESAANFRELLALEEQRDAKAKALLATLNPLAAAQDRYNQEVRELGVLRDSGRLNEEQFIALQGRAKAALDATSASSVRAASSANLQRAGYQQLGFQLNDVVTSLAGGANPMMVFAQQASQIGQALQMIGGGAGGEGGAAGNAASAIGEANDAVDAAKGTYENAKGAAEALSSAVGKNSAVETVNTETKAVNTTATATNATSRGAATAAIGAETAATTANTTATGTATAAKLSFASVLGGPWGAAIIAGTVILGTLAAKYFDNSEAAKEAEKANKALADAIIAETSASRAAINTGERERFMRLAVANAAMEQARATREATRAKLEQKLAEAETAANAQQRSGTIEEGVVAAATAAAAGREAEALRAQLAKNDAAISAAEASAVRRRAAVIQRSVQESLDPALRITGRYDRAVDLLNRRLETGRITAEGYRAEYVRLAEGRERETKALERQSAGTAGQIARETAATTATSDLARARANLSIVLAEGKAAEKEGGAALEAYRARLTEAREAVNSAKAAQDAATQGRREAGRAAREMAREVREATKAEQEFVAALLKTNAELIQRGNEAQERMVGLLKVRVEPVAGESGDDALKRIVADIEKRKEGAREWVEYEDRIRREKIQGLAGFFRDAMNGGSGSIWSTFKSWGQRIISELAAEWVVAMAAKNGVSGGSGLLGTLIGAGRSLLGISTGFDSGAADAATSAMLGNSAAAFRLDQMTGLPGRNAAGTEYFSGGATWVAENGPELVTLPMGSRITPANDTRRLMAANDERPAPPTIIINANDAVLASTVRGWVVEAIDIAAQRGATAGVGEMQRQNRRSGARQLIGARR